ncbi:SCO family protein [Algibacter sp. L4_22]|uniref:SCO family protein n=1 Tax=Algibacter sp. L4_22 TaxID=2942477 RepID=UPI00201B90F7|nr:SCO family protein [Algibacter sp. L4_22]MCL5129899.1 SCO family protein [Algibacter sp. L4_22]
MYRIVFFLISSILLIGCNGNKKQLQNIKDTIALPYYNDPTFTPVFIKDKSSVQKEITHTIADFEFLNQDSVLVNQNIIKNKIHVANFIFTTCGSICPIMTDNLRIVSDSLQNNKDLVFLSYSVTPWIDTPSKLNTYKKIHDITNKNWQFLTGSKSDIYKLARQSYYAEEDIGFSRDSTEFLHTEHLILVDKSKKIRGIYNGTVALDMKALINDINTLKNEE